jgi:hypothetical protein
VKHVLSFCIGYHRDAGRRRVTDPDPRASNGTAECADYAAPVLREEGHL